MAKSSSAMFFNLALILSLLLIASVAESRSLGPMVTFPAGSQPELECRSVIDVKNADNCEALEKEFNLSRPVFESFNPNLNCNALFIGQWLCIDAFLAA